MKAVTNHIPFNKPYFTGKETEYIRKAIELGKIAGDGHFTAECHRFFQEKFGYRKPLLTTSCTAALEMAAILAGIGPGDEVIVPSFTFVSTANAFVLRGAKVVFADSLPDHPNIDPGELESLISEKTKAIVPVHYAGLACDMDTIMNIAWKHKLIVIEDAAHAINSSYKGKFIGTFGSMATFSFHETKNIISGEGGMLVINDEQLINRAEILREKGTNRSAFFRGEVDKYEWVDIGSSYLPSDLLAAFLYAQLEEIEKIQSRRVSLWNSYYSRLKNLSNEGYFELPSSLADCSGNAHVFYLVCRSNQERTLLMEHLIKDSIDAVFHYMPLHKSPYYSMQHVSGDLPNAERFSETLVRLPLYFELEEVQVERICESIEKHYRSC